MEQQLDLLAKHKERNQQELLFLPEFQLDDCILEEPIEERDLEERTRKLRISRRAITLKKLYQDSDQEEEEEEDRVQYPASSVFLDDVRQERSGKRKVSKTSTLPTHNQRKQKEEGGFEAQFQNMDFDEILGDD